MDKRAKVVLGVGAAVGAGLLIVKAIKGGSAPPPPPPPPNKANLYGVVSNAATGQPVAGAEVTLELPGVGQAKVTTGSNGAFQFLGLDMETYQLSCLKSGYAEYSQIITPVEGNNQCDITLNPVAGTFGTVEGHVSDIVTSKYLPGVEVSLESGDYRQEYTTGEDGLFRFTDVPTGKAICSGSRSGYQPVQMEVTIPEGILRFSFPMAPIDDPDYQAIFGAQAAALGGDQFALFAATYKILSLNQLEITTVWAHNCNPIEYPELNYKEWCEGWLDGTIDGEWHPIDPPDWNSPWPVTGDTARQVLVKKDTVTSHLTSENHVVQRIKLNLIYGVYDNGVSGSDSIGTKTIVPVRIG